MSEAFKRENEVSPYDQIHDRTPEELQRADELTEDLDYRILPDATNDEILSDAAQKAREEVAAYRANRAINDPTYVEAEKITLADTFGAGELELADAPTINERNQTDNDPNSLNVAQSEIANSKIAGSNLENATLSDNPARTEASDLYNRTGSNFATPRSVAAPAVKKKGFFGKLFGG